MTAELNTLGVYVKPYQNFQVDEEQLRILLNTINQRTASAINLKDTGIYQTIEQINSQTFFDTNNPQQVRNAFRKCFVVPAIATSGTAMITHDISGVTTYTRIYGTCITDAPDNRPIPYSAITTTDNIEMKVTSTQIVIANGSTAPNITSGIVVLEYLKQ